VGLDVKPGFAPAGLRSGAAVRLVLVQPDTTSGPLAAPPMASPVLAQRASVLDVASTPDGQAQIVSVVVDNELAPAVATAGARGEVSIILLGGPG
jgi:hypothetical protein